MTMLQLLFLMILILITILFILAIRRKGGIGKEYSGCRHPPGPPMLPIIGNLYHFLYNSNIHFCLTQLSKEYGPIMYMKVVNVPVIVISSAKLAKQVLKHNDLAFSSRPVTIASSKLSYNNLDIVCSPYTSYWREMRKTMVLHLFSLKQVRSFRHIREDEVSRMINEIRDKGNSDVVINLSETIISFTSSLICRVAFGKRHGDTASGNRRFEKLLHDLATMIISVFVGNHFPPLGWIDKLTGNVTKLDRVFKDLDCFYQELIDEHLSPNRLKSMDGDVIDLLLKLRESSSGITWDHIKPILMNVFAAGTESSAVSITWAMTALMKKPSAMKKAQEEIRSFIGTKGRVDEDDIEKLHYLKAVIMETMRLYPPVVALPRETREKCDINGYEIEPKTFVYFNVWAIGRDPMYWENADEFFPERFSNSNIDFRGQDFGLIPFGTGRRICPGMSLALASVELALANLLYSFDWEMPHGMRQEDIDTEVLPGVTLRKKNDLRLVAKSYYASS